MSEALTAGSTVIGGDNSSRPAESGTVVGVGFHKAMILWGDGEVTREMRDDVVRHEDAGIGGLVLMHFFDGLEL